MRDIAPAWAQRGSKLQMQLYVNTRPEQLTSAILDQVEDMRNEATGLRWTSPMAPSFAEFRDGSFLAAVGQAALSEKLERFWPARGPVWDALAVVATRAAPGVLLIEAKSYPGEVYGSGSQAGASKTSAALESRDKIVKALKWTQQKLGVDVPVERWMDPIRPDVVGNSSVYQSANRYAHLLWLRDQGVPAWLVHLLVVDDPTFNLTSRAAWEAALPVIESDLGLSGVSVPGATHVCVQGLAPTHP